jgi:hypothetical protein
LQIRFAGIDFQSGTFLARRSIWARKLSLQATYDMPCGHLIFVS